MEDQPWNTASADDEDGGDTVLDVDETEQVEEVVEPEPVVVDEPPQVVRSGRRGASRARPTKTRGGLRSKAAMGLNGAGRPKTN